MTLTEWAWYMFFAQILFNIFVLYRFTRTPYIKKKEKADEQG